MQSLESILTIPTLLLAVGIYIVTYCIRKGIEIRWPSLSATTSVTKGQMVWERLVLVVMPAVLGMVFCLLAKPQAADSAAGFPYPPVVVGYASRALYGLATGWFADFLYRVFKFLLKKQWNISLPGDSGTPDPTAEAKKPVDVPQNPPVKP